MHTIQLSDNDIAVIFDALGELKLKVAGPVFTSIQQQLMQQDSDWDKKHAHESKDA